MLKSRVEANQFPVWGSKGNEIYFGGRVAFSKSIVNDTWDDIESNTPIRRSDPERTIMPAGRQDLKSHFLIRIADFEEEEGQALMEPTYETDNNGLFLWYTGDGPTYQEQYADLQPEPVGDDHWEPKETAKRRNSLDDILDIAGTYGVDESALRSPQKSVDVRLSLDPINPTLRDNAKDETRNPRPLGQKPNQVGPPRRDT
jgi:hypothetical protein